MPHSVQVSFGEERREGEWEKQRIGGYWENWGNGARPVSWISSWGNSRISVRYFCYFLIFSVFFSVLFLFCVCFFLFAFRLQSNQQQFCRCFVFPIQLKSDSSKNFIMKLNRCQFIRLATRRVLRGVAVPCPMPWYLLRVLPGLPTPVVHFLRPLVVLAFLPAHFPFPASFAATNR